MTDSVLSLPCDTNNAKHQDFLRVERAGACINFETEVNRKKASINLVRCDCLTLLEFLADMFQEMATPDMFQARNPPQ